MFGVVLGGVAVWIWLFAGLARIQIADHADYKEQAERQHKHRVEITCCRGGIYDRHGDLLVGTISTPTIIANPAEVRDPWEAGRLLGPILGLPSSKIRERLNRKGNFVYLARKIDHETGERAMAAALPGIHSLTEKARVRPHGGLALQTLGITNVDNVGIEGIEKQFDSVLRGVSGWTVLQAMPKRRSLSLPDFPHRPPEAGSDLILTLDAGVQSIVELEMKRAMTKSGAACGMAIAMEPSTGDILAIVNCEQETGGAQGSSLLNRCVTDQFEPGSTYKLITYAAALDRGVVGLDEIFDAGMGKMRFGSYAIHDHEKYDTLSVLEAFELSSNIVTAQIALRMGVADLYSYSRAFGFGSLTAIALPAEHRGVLREPEKWSGRSLATISIGQEVAVTMVQLVSAYAAIANGGFLMEPRMVKEIRSPDGRVVERFPPRPVRRVVRPETAAIMVDLLQGVVERGTGKEADLGIWATAGKSGTAQIYERGGFARDRFTSSFIGFAPAEAPKIVVAVVLTDVSGLYWGGMVAGPVFREILTKVACSDLGEPFEEALRKKAVSTWIDLETAPDPPEFVSAGGEEDVLSSMPDLTGLLLREAKSLLLRAEASVSLIGAGVVAAQEPPPGADIRPGDTCRLIGSRP